MIADILIRKCTLTGKNEKWKSTHTNRNLALLKWKLIHPLSLNAFSAAISSTFLYFWRMWSSGSLTDVWVNDCSPEYSLVPTHRKEKIDKLLKTSHFYIKSSILFWLKNLRDVFSIEITLWCGGFDTWIRQ